MGAAVCLLIPFLVLASPGLGHAREPFEGYSEEVRLQAAAVVAAAGPGREAELAREVETLRKKMLARGVLSMNQIPDDIVARAARERWKGSVGKSVRAVTPVSALSVPMWSWLIKEDIVRFDPGSFFDDVHNLAGTIRWFGPALMGYAAWAVSFLSAAACWFVVWAALLLFLRARPSLEYDIFRIARYPGSDYAAAIVAFLVFVLPMLLGAGLAVVACIWLLLATAYLRRAELVLVVWCVVLLFGVIVAGGAADSLADMAGDVGTSRWLAGEGYVAASGAKQAAISPELDEVTDPWMIRFATARREMQAGNPAEAERVWTELLAEGKTLPEIYNNRGIARAQQGRSKEALADFKSAIEKRPDDAPSLWNAYQSHLQAFDLDQASAIQPRAWETVAAMSPFGFRPSAMDQTEWIASTLPVSEIWRGYLEKKEDWIREAASSDFFQWFFRPFGLTGAFVWLGAMLAAVGVLKALTAKYWMSSTCRSCGLHLLLAGSKEVSDLCTPCRGQIGDAFRGGDERERRLQTIGLHAKYVRICSVLAPGSGALWAGKEIRTITYGVLLALSLAGVTVTLGGIREGGGLITSLQGIFLGISIAGSVVLWAAGALWSIWSFNTMQQRSNLPMPKR